MIAQRGIRATGREFKLNRYQLIFVFGLMQKKSLVK